MSQFFSRLPYFVRMSEGEGEKTFVSVFEGYGGNEALVRNVKLIDKTGILELATTMGQTTLCLCVVPENLKLEQEKTDRIVGPLCGSFAALQKIRLVLCDSPGALIC